MKLKKIFLFCLLLIPAITLIFSAYQNSLGPDPAEALADATGEWALRLLLLTLAITPLGKMTGWIQLKQYRRMVGLYAFFYAVLHLLVFAVFLLGGQWTAIWQALNERPYIIVGFLSFLLLIPLAITSTHGWLRRLGRRWRQLHLLVYPATIFALVHLFWQVRSDWAEALAYASIAALLITIRFLPLLQRH